MPRENDIQFAFMAAVQLNPKGYQYLQTCDFIRELRSRGWFFTEKEATAWIKRYQGDFTDKTTQQTENRYWILRAMGRVW